MVGYIIGLPKLTCSHLLGSSK